MRAIRRWRRLWTLPVRGYQRFISPHTVPKCKYYPTCSSYAVQAIERFGPLAGGALAVWRLLRCHPWAKGGMDPVPEKLFGKYQRRK